MPGLARPSSSATAASTAHVIERCRRGSARTSRWRAGNRSGILAASERRGRRRRAMDVPLREQADDAIRFSPAERWAIVACAISMLIVQMDWFALNLAIPAIAREFHMASTDLQWVVSGYMISIGALMVTAGRLADIFGRRKIIVWGLAIFGGMSIACGASPSEWWLIAFRVIHGIGAALVFPVTIAVVSSTFTGIRQSRAIGIVLGFAAIGTALGPFVGGAFSEYWTWRGVFFINVPFCIVAIALMLRYVHESRDDAAERHIDVPGIATITAGLVCVSVAFDRGEAWGWLSAATLGTLVAGAVLIALFVMIESKVRAPLVDLGLFRNRVFDGVVIAGSLSNVVFCLVAVFSALYLQQARGYSPFQSGLIFLALSAGTGLGWALTNVATQAVVKPAEVGAASGVTLTCLVMLGAVSVAIAAAMLELLSGSVEGAAADAPAIHIVLRVGAALAVEIG